jgi:hypothetical protein
MYFYAIYTLFILYFEIRKIVLTFDTMMTKTTISIDDSTLYTAQQTQIKKLRGGFSEYVELLIIRDLGRKGVELMEKPYNEPEIKTEAE